MKKIIIHIGVHKTGSSSIQKTLDGFDDGKTRYARLGDLNHSIPLYSIFSSNRFERRHFLRQGLSEKEMAETVAAFDTRLSRELTQDRETLILSAEDLSILKNENDVRSLKQRLSPHTDRIEVLAYMRDPVGFASSSFQQKVRVGYSQLAIPHVTYKDRFQPYLSVFGLDALQFVKFDPAQFPDNSVTQDFLARIGIAREAVAEQQANASMSAAATRLLFLFNREGPLAQGNPMVFEARKQFTIDIRRATPGEGFKIPVELITSEPGFTEDQIWLEQATGITFHNDTIGTLTPQQIQAGLLDHMQVTAKDVGLLRAYCAKTRIRIPSNAGALQIMSLMFYRQIYRLGRKKGH